MIREHVAKSYAKNILASLNFSGFGFFAHVAPLFENIAGKIYLFPSSAARLIRGIQAPGQLNYLRQLSSRGDVSPLIFAKNILS
jgi:hypothetical protein